MPKLMRPNYVSIHNNNVVVTDCESNSNGSCQKRGVKCHFATLNSVLALMNSVFAPMVDVKMGCYFNNSMFFIKKYN